jgi:hypothetical protein
MDVGVNQKRERIDMNQEIAFGKIVRGAIVLTCGLMLMAAPMAAAEEESTLRVTIPAGDYQIVEDGQGQRISLEGFGSLLIPGKPHLPSKIFAVAVPPDAQVVGVSFETDEVVALPGTFNITPAPLPRVIGKEDPAVSAREQQRYERNYKAVYGADDPYPAAPVEFVRTARYRKYNLVDVRVTPFSYRPSSGQLTFYPNLTVVVSYKISPGAASVIIDQLPRTERVARDIIYNYEGAQGWYPRAASAGDRSLHDFVIITTSSLLSSINSLVDWESFKGRSVEVVTVSWIDTQYGGYDLAEKMRNFLREKYPSDQWGIEDVLFIGDHTDVPMRLTWQDLGYGKPRTDFYFSELSLPDDESWDADGDHKYGEDSDPIDFYGEVNVGRIPWSDPAVVQSICEKTVAYEQNDDPEFKQNILLLGAYFWSDTDNAVLMEAKVDQPWMAEWSMLRMYEQNSTYWSMYDCDYPLLQSNVVDIWSNGSFAFVDWAGHGSPTSCHIAGMGAPAFIASSDCVYLNDNYPAIIFADACSNSDTEYLNIGKAMLQQGAVGFWGSTEVALGCPGWNDPTDGSSQTLDYLFTTCVTSGEYTIGQAQQYSLHEMYVNGYWGYNKYETFEWGAIWGNPNLSMVSSPLLRMELPDGAPIAVSPTEETNFGVRIISQPEDYIEGSATVHYCYSGDTYSTVPLTHIEEDLYQATLPPADCEDTPGFYLTAEGAESGLVFLPKDAPQKVFNAGVGEVIVALGDDFEADQDWSVEDIELDDGSWERGVPVGGGLRGDPPTDWDGSGQCYLTANRAGNSDVDGGPTRLISPIFSVDGLRTPTLQYARWFTNDDSDQDRLDVEISNDGGQSWVVIECVVNNDGWVWRKVPVSNYVEPTTQMRVRFSAADNPNNSVDEGAVDAFQAYGFACESVGTGDFDFDGDVDLKDFRSFQGCFGQSAAGGCYQANLAGGATVDLDDYALFYGVMNGPQ